MNNIKKFIKKTDRKLYNEAIQPINGGMKGTNRTDGHYDGRGIFIAHKKTGRNDKCPCGSGKKYKHCCMNKKSEGKV